MVRQQTPFRFTEREMDIAKGTDLPDLLTHLGYQVRRVGSYYTTREMDSLRIKERRTWRRYSNQTGGDAIAFLQEFCGKDFREAVNYLLEFNGHRARASPVPHQPSPAKKERPAFALPSAAPDQRHVFAYRGKYPKNLTASGAFPILTHCSVRRMPAMRQPERQHNRKGVRETSNQKYEITDIAHEKYPFLHRIRALRDIRPDIKAGDLGGFVESESNLSTELEDNAWIYDDAVVCNNGYADRGAVLRNEAIVCGDGYISHGAVVSGHSRVEDSAYVRGAVLNGHARASGCAVVRCSRESGHPPILSGHCAVYGNVSGDVRLTGSTVIISGEEIYNDTLDTLVISGQNRSVIRHPARDELAPQIPEPQQEKKQRKEVER